MLPGILAVGHRPLVFGKVLAQDPAFAGAGAVRKGLVIRSHAGSRDGVGVISWDVGDVVRLGERASAARMIHVIAA